MFNLTGKAALITGASGGIGTAIARALHGAGAVVGLSGRNEEKLAVLAEELGDRTHILPADLSDVHAAETLTERAINGMGSVDILVNNAGITRDALAIRMGDDAWQAVLNTNLTIPFVLAKIVARSMMKTRAGRIINISSVVATTGNAGQANYCAAKAGLEGWSRALALELAPRGITVNCIAPGFIVTAMTDGLSESHKAALMARIPAARLGLPEDIAAAALYLASPAASYVTGHVLHVNGGMVMV